MKKKICLALTFIIFIEITNGNQHRHSTEYGCSKCPPGYHVAKPCLHRNNTVCVPCEAKTYLPHNSYKQKCYICSECGRDLYVAHPCTPVRDTICDSCHTYNGPKNMDYQIRCAKYIKLGDSGLHHESNVARKTIPSNRQAGRLQQLEDFQEEEQPSNTYLAMMLVGVGACAVACLLTGIVVYSCYGTKKWKEGPSYLYKGMYSEDSPTSS